MQQDTICSFETLFFRVIYTVYMSHGCRFFCKFHLFLSFSTRQIEPLLQLYHTDAHMTSFILQDLLRITKNASV